jgi:hypothetical protein
MAISRKPSAPGEAKAVDVDALIGRGGSPAKATDKAIDQEPQGVVPIVLRVPSDMLEKIDVSVKARPIRTPRHTWLLEAVHEKLARENDIN